MLKLPRFLKYTLKSINLSKVHLKYILFIYVHYRTYMFLIYIEDVKVIIVKSFVRVTWMSDHYGDLKVHIFT